MFSREHFEIAGTLAVALGPTLTVLWVVGRWGFHQVMKRQDETNAHLDKINGRLDTSDEYWQTQREINAHFAAKIGEDIPLRKGQDALGVKHNPKEGY